MEQRLIAQGTGLNNVINVYSDRVEIRTGWQSQNADSLGLKQIANVSIRGLVNCTLTIEVNDGRRLAVERMALPDARQVKAAIESQKQKAGLYE
jgi:Bacterial PH domain